ncbi:hypothetical protein HBB16_05735 [Pseudonocardia sp. MCCB 268]|nr:hypothetical protein [Pseudonocardia cytotoxica]
MNATHRGRIDTVGQIAHRTEERDSRLTSRPAVGPARARCHGQQGYCSGNKRGPSPASRAPRVGQEHYSSPRPPSHPTTSNDGDVRGRHFEVLSIPFVVVCLALAMRPHCAPPDVPPRTKHGSRPVPAATTAPREASVPGGLTARTALGPGALKEVSPR